MAYICTKGCNCSECPHYRYDEDRQEMCCWAQADEEAENNASHSKPIE